MWKSRHRRKFWRWYWWRIILFLKLLSAFLCSLFHCLFTSLSWAHLRVWNVYALINLACCWIYCNLKLHSSPNKTFYTFKVIWKYFLTYLLIKNIKGIPRYASFQLFFFFCQTWVTVFFFLVWKVLVLIFISVYHDGCQLELFLNDCEIQL